MDFHPREPRAERERETVVGRRAPRRRRTASRDGTPRGDSFCNRRCVSVAPSRDISFQHRIVQIGPARRPISPAASARAPAPSRTAWRGWNAAGCRRSAPMLTSSTVPASTTLRHRRAPRRPRPAWCSARPSVRDRAAPACRSPAIGEAHANAVGTTSTDPSRNAPSTNTSRGASSAGSRASRPRNRRRRRQRSWNEISASGRRLVYFHASSRASRQTRAAKRRAPPRRASRDRRAAGRASPRSAPGRPRACAVFACGERVHAASAITAA